MNSQTHPLTDVKKAPARDVLIVDAPQRWIRQPADLVGAFVAFVSVAGVVFLALYARLTVLGVTSDVRAATSSFVEQILFIPINTVQGLVSFFLPITLILDMLFRRRWRALATAVAASASTVVLVQSSRFFIEYAMRQEWISTVSPLKMFTEPIPYLAVISALLIVAGTYRGSRLVRCGWILTIIVIVLSALQGMNTPPNAVATILLGIGVAFCTRFIIGTLPRRLTGTHLVDLIRRSGIDPVDVIRYDADVADSVSAWTVQARSPIGYIDMSALQRLATMWNKSDDERQVGDALEITEQISTISPASGVNAADLSAGIRSSFPAFRPESVSRMYVVRDIHGETFYVHVLDEDQLIVSVLADLWRQLRFKVAYRENSRTLHDAAQHHILMQLATEDAGISEQLFVGSAHADSSVCIVYRTSSSVLLDDVDGEIITDEQLDAFWQTVQTAHLRGLSHGDIHAGCVRYSDAGLQITQWQAGSIMTGETVRLVDLAQSLAMLSGVVGINRAVDSLSRAIPFERIMSLAPLLQKTLMPARTREDFPKAKDFQTVRQVLEERLPDMGSMEPIEVKRFSPKTIITVSIGVIAVYLLAASVNFEELAAAIKSANMMWMILSFSAGLLTYLGAAITLKAYTREHVPLGQSIIIQIAASLVTLVAPAGIGPAALNMRFLQKKNVATAAAVATVTVVQVAQFVTTILSLAVLTLITGELGSLSMPSESVMIGITVGVAALGSIFLIKPLRRWILRKIQPTVEQIWPRLVWLGTHPQRLLLGLLGSLIMTIAFIACFGFALGAFGYQLPLVTLAVTYLISNSVGSLVPSPGGIGPVEAALTGGLVLAGIPYSVALSTAVLYRLFTFWGRVPLGWIALRIATKKNYI